MTSDPTPTLSDEPAPRPLTGGAVMTAASRVVVAATGALTTILLARVLGPGGSGTYALAQNVLFVLTVLTTLGLEHGIAYYVSAGRWPAPRALSAALRLAVGTGVIGALALIGTRAILPSPFGALSFGSVGVLAAALPFALAAYYVGYIALAVDRYEAYVLPPAIQSTATMALAGAGALAFGAEGAVVALACAVVLTGLGTVAWGRARLRAGDGPEEPHQLRNAVSFGVKGYAANTLQLLNYRLDLFILAAVASAAAVGQYAVAMAVTGLLWLLPQALSEVVFPRVAHLHARKGEPAAAHLEMVEVKSFRHVVLAVVVVTSVLAAALLLLVVPIYGKEFRPAITVGLLLLPGAALLGIASVMSATIVGRGHPAYNLYVVLVTTPVTIALYALLIPPHHAIGAALASTISYAATFLLTAWFYRRVTGRRLRPLFVPTASELEDLLRLPAAGVAWARGLRS